MPIVRRHLDRRRADVPSVWRGVMRYIITTTDPDKHRAHLDGPRWRDAMEEMAKELRTADKHGQGSPEYQAGIKWARDLLWRTLTENCLSID